MDSLFGSILKKAKTGIENEKNKNEIIPVFSPTLPRLLDVAGVPRGKNVVENSTNAVAAGTSALPGSIPRALVHEKEILLKVLVVGGVGVGKTSIVRRIVQDVFTHRHIPTFGFDLHSCWWTPPHFRGPGGRKEPFSEEQIGFSIPEYPVRLQIWDVAFQELKGSHREKILADSDGSLVVFDPRDRSSIRAVDEWRAAIEQEALLRRLRRAKNLPIQSSLLRQKDGLAVLRNEDGSASPLSPSSKPSLRENKHSRVAGRISHSSDKVPGNKLSDNSPSRIGRVEPDSPLRGRHAGQPARTVMNRSSSESGLSNLAQMTPDFDVFDRPSMVLCASKIDQLENEPIQTISRDLGSYSRSGGYEGWFLTTASTTSRPDGDVRTTEESDTSDNMLVSPQEAADFLVNVIMKRLHEKEQWLADKRQKAAANLSRRRSRRPKIPPSSPKKGGHARASSKERLRSETTQLGTTEATPVIVPSARPPPTVSIKKNIDYVKESEDFAMRRRRRLFRSLSVGVEGPGQKEGESRKSGSGKQLPNDDDFRIDLSPSVLHDTDLIADQKLESHIPSTATPEVNEETEGTFTIDMSPSILLDTDILAHRDIKEDSTTLSTSIYAVMSTKEVVQEEKATAVPNENVKLELETDRLVDAGTSYTTTEIVRLNALIPQAKSFYSWLENQLNCLGSVLNQNRLPDLSLLQDQCRGELHNFEDMVTKAIDMTEKSDVLRIPTPTLKSNLLPDKQKDKEESRAVHSDGEVHPARKQTRLKRTVFFRPGSSPESRESVCLSDSQQQVPFMRKRRGSEVYYGDRKPEWNDNSKSRRRGTRKFVLTAEKIQLALTNNITKWQKSLQALTIERALFGVGFSSMDADSTSAEGPTNLFVENSWSGNDGMWSAHWRAMETFTDLSNRLLKTNTSPVLAPNTTVNTLAKPESRSNRSASECDVLDSEGMETPHNSLPPRPPRFDANSPGVLALPVEGNSKPRRGFSFKRGRQKPPRPTATLMSKSLDIPSPLKTMTNTSLANTISPPTEPKRVLDRGISVPGLDDLLADEALKEATIEAVDSVLFGASPESTGQFITDVDTLTESEDEQVKIVMTEIKKRTESELEEKLVAHDEIVVPARPREQSAAGTWDFGEDEDEEG